MTPEHNHNKISFQAPFKTHSKWMQAKWKGEGEIMMGKVFYFQASVRVAVKRKEWNKLYGKAASCVSV